jgi:phospholipid/cholesterol/gamma-HCH transport system substrate-binding protein
MKRTDVLRWSQLKIGILLVVGFLILLWVAFNSDLAGTFRREDPLLARFANADGLIAGAPVFFLGMEAGSVKSVDLDPNESAEPILIRFEVTERVREELRDDASVRIASQGILGDKYLDVAPGTSARPLPDEAVLRGSRERGLTDLLEPGTEVLGRVDSLLVSLDVVVAGLREGRGSLGRLLTEDSLHVDLVRTLDETRGTLAEFRRTQRQVGTQLTRAVGSIDSLASGWQQADGSLNRLARDPSLYENLNAAAVRLERVLAHVERGDGLLARLLDDPQFADQVGGLVVDLRALLQDMRENPGRYVSFSVF